jgi:hypothetical protein
VPLTAATEYTWAVEGNGIAGTGLVGYRRIRLHLVEVAQIEDDDVLDAVDSTGTTVTAGTTADSSAASTLTPPASRDYLCLSFFQGQFSAWPRAFFLVGAGPTQEPAVGYINAAVGTGIGATDDMTMNFGLHLQSGVASSTALGLRYEGAAGGGNCTYGNNCAHADAGDIHLLSIRLYTPDAPPAGGDAVFFGSNF